MKKIHTQRERSKEKGQEENDKRKRGHTTSKIKNTKREDR